MDERKSARAQAQALLLMAYGGRLSHPDMGYTEEQVAWWLLDERDRLLEREIAKDGDAFQPDVGYYTVHEEQEVLWDASSQAPYVLLPNGNPPWCPYDRGVRVEPAQGMGAMFVRTAYNWCQMNHRLAWLEGNIPWELRPGRVLFPTLRPGDIGKVRLMVIEAGVRDIDRPMAMPPRMAAECRDMVMQRMGFGRQDNRLDARDARLEGGRT